MARITIEDGQLVVHIEGLDRILALKSSIRVPLAHVRAVTPRPEIPSALNWRLIRAPGTLVPGVVRAGSFYHVGEGWYFFDVHDPEKSVAIDLADEHYKRLVVQVDGERPEEAAARIAAAVSALPPRRG